MSKQAARSLHFGTDLRDQSVHHIAFLKAVDNVADLKEPYILKRAIYRYEKYWLPLAADHLKQCLAAPLDIEWVWHCHMLSPRAYERDCAATVGVTVNHTLRSAKQFQDKQQEAQRYWSQKYEGDHEPFFVDLSAPYDINAVESHKSKISYDIISAAQRQSVFYYQVSLPHYRDKKYLDNSLLRYKQFIYLKSQLPYDFLVPCYDIDLMWHSHQVNPLIYTQDMVRIIGNLFNHDDSTNDRSEGSKLHIADKKTRQHWKNHYNESFSLFGAMYRGNPPAGFLYKISSEETYGFCTKNSIITLEQLTLTLPSENPNRYKKIKLLGFSSVGYKTIDKWFAVNRPKDATPLATTLTWKGVGHFQFDTKTSNNVTFLLQEQVGWGCCGSKTDVGSNVINLLPQVESSANAATGGRINSQILLGANIPLDIQGQFAPPKRERALLFLDQGKYEVAVIPENVQQLWGPISLERLPPGTDNHCQVASHRLKNHLGNTKFTVRTIHSQPLMMSVVQVYYHDGMSVIGHLIASDQLPLPTQVSKDEITLNPKQGERAVLLKNNEGDWGIITGHWKGFKRGVAGTKRIRGVRGSPGTLFLKFYKFSTGRITTVELGYLRQDYMFTIESAQIDLMKGVLSIDSATNEVAESIAIAFSVSLLHVLCVPRPKGWVEGQQVKPSLTSRGSRSMTTVPSDDMAFIMAAGLLWATPSNYYMHSYYGAHICAMCGGGGGGAMEYEGDWGDLPGGDADGGDAGCDGSACGGGADGGGCGG